MSPLRPLALAGILLGLAACVDSDAIENPETLAVAEAAVVHDALALAGSIANRHIATHPPETLLWDWRPATLMAGLAELGEATGDPAYMGYVQRYLDAQLSGGRPIIEKSDDCAPALAAVALYQETGDARYREVVDDVLDYLHHRAARTRHGGISHFGTTPGVAPTLWVDSLFTFGEVLIRWGEQSGDRAALDLYGEQLRIFTADLQDRSGFFKHANPWIKPQTPGVYWGRGNGWVLASAGSYLLARRARGERDPAAEAVFRRLAAAVVDAQDEDTGLWWTVVNRPGETYLETSASALFALGLTRGYRAGVLDASVLPVIDAALVGLNTRIVGDDEGRPVVTGISGPTNAGTFDHYARVPVEEDLDYGVGVVLMALVEVSRSR